MRLCYIPNKESPDIMEGSLSVYEDQVPLESPGSPNMIIFTYVGCGFTILSALIIVVYLPSKCLLKSHCCQNLFGFCLSLIGLNATYIADMVFMDKGQIGVLQCRVLAGCLHYFVLGTAAWTVMESINVWLVLQNKLDGFGVSFISIASMLAWGIPAVIVVTTSLVTKKDYVLQDICFVNPMIASVVTPLAVAVTINIIIYIFGTMKFLRLFLKKSDILRVYDASMIRLGNDYIVLVLLILNFLFGYLAWLPSTYYFSQPLLCFLCIIFGFTLLFLYIIRKPFTHLRALYTNSTKSSKLTTEELESQKRPTKWENKKRVLEAYDNKRRENEYVNHGGRPIHVEGWNRYSNKSVGYQIPRAGSFHGSISNDRSSSVLSKGSRPAYFNQNLMSSVVSNGRRSAYFNPNSVSNGASNGKHSAYFNASSGSNEVSNGIRSASFYTNSVSNDVSNRSHSAYFDPSSGSNDVSNGRRSAYYNPNSVPMAQIQQNRFENYAYMKYNKETYADHDNDGWLHGSS